MMLSVRDVHFSYSPASGFTLKGVSLELEPGEIVGVIGPNGSGKSTLLRLCTGLYRANRGEIVLDGQPITAYDARAIAQRIGVVWQQVNVRFGFTVWELAALGRQPHHEWWGGLSKREKRLVKEVLVEVGLWEKRDRPVTQLSGGERQLCFLARALVQEPRLLFLDEATSNLDMGHTRTILEGVRKRVKQDGLGVLAVFHDLNVAGRFCDRLLVLRQGECAGQGCPETVLNRSFISELYGLPQASIGWDEAKRICWYEWEER
ncbi:MAG: ABC transporter ATP-binding protein [Lentisphaerae bacterium]|nr:MAG: ABC transporter ATP-binding protein [Lentisphaerota bacterium]